MTGMLSGDPDADDVEASPLLAQPNGVGKSRFMVVHRIAQLWQTTQSQQAFVGEQAARQGIYDQDASARDFTPSCGTIYWKATRRWEQGYRDTASFLAIPRKTNCGRCRLGTL
jgi:hypothetical protein